MVIEPQSWDIAAWSPFKFCNTFCSVGASGDSRTLASVCLYGKLFQPLAPYPEALREPLHKLLAAAFEADGSSDRRKIGLERNGMARSQTPRLPS